MRDFDAWLKALVSNDRQLADELRAVREAKLASLGKTRGLDARARKTYAVLGADHEMLA